MDGAVDKRIVEMQFDNDQFEKGIKESIRSLEDLKKALELDKAAESLNNLDKAVSGSMKNIEESASSMASSLERMLDPIDTFVRNKLESIVSSIANAGERLVKAVSIDAIHDGLAEYEELTKTTKTITNMVKGLDQFGGNEAAAFDAVTKQLNELNEYADKTIYGFNDMTTSYLKFVQNLGNTTSVEQATKDVEGLFNAAAYYGLNKTQAQMVSRNLAQAMGLGYMGMRDWWSFVNAGMASDDFKMRAIQAAVEVGSLDESGHIIDATGKAARKATVDLESFNETLQFKWFNKAVMERLFQQYSDGSTQLGRDAMEAATKVRTFKDMIDSLKEALGTGWASTFTLLFGDMYTIEKRLTAIKETFETIINYLTDKRNKAVSQWLDVGQYGRDPRNYVPGHYDVNMEDHTSGYVEAHYEDQENVDALTRSVENLGNALLNVFGLFDGISEAIGRGFKTGYADSMFKQWTDLFTVIGITPGNIEKASKGLLSMSESLYYALNATEEGEWARDSTFWDILHIAELIGSAFGFVVDAITPFAGLLDDVVLAITPLADVGLHIVAVLARMGTAILNQIREWGLFKKVAKVIEKLLLGIRIAFTIVADTIRAFVNWLFDGFYLGKFSDDIKGLWESLKNFGTKILDKLSALADKISKWYENAKQWIKDNEVLQKWKKSLTDFFTNLGNNIHAKIDQLFTNPSEFFKPLKEWFTSFLASGLSLFGVENPEETAAKIVADIEGTVKKIKDGVTNTIAIIGSIFDPVEGSEDMSISEQLNERIHRLDELFEPIKTGLYGKLVDFLAWLGANDPLGKAEEIKTKVKAFVQSLSSIFDEIVRMLGEIGKPKHDQAQVMSSKTMIDELTGEEFELIGGVDGAATVIIDVAENSSESAEEMLARLQKVIEESQLSKNFTELQNLLLSGFGKVFDNFLNWLGLPHFEEITAKIEPELQKFGKQISDAVKLVYDSVFNFFHKPQQTITQAEGGGAYADVEYLSPFQSATANVAEAFGQIPKWFEDLKKAISDTVFKAFADFLAWLGTENPEQKATEIVESIRSTFGKVANVLGTIGSVISESITGAFKRRTVALGDGSDIIELGLAESIALNIQDATKSLPDILDGIGKGMTKILESILEAFGSSDPAADTQKVIEKIDNAFGALSKIFTTVLGWIHKIFGGGGEKGEAAELEEALDSVADENKTQSLADKIQNVIGTLMSPFFASASAEELDTSEMEKAADEVGKNSSIIDDIGGFVSDFVDNITKSTEGTEVDKLLNVAGRGGKIIGLSALAIGGGNALFGLGQVAKESARSESIFSGGLLGMSKFLEFSGAVWLAVDSLSKLNAMSIGDLTSALGKLVALEAVIVGGSSGNEALDALIQKQINNNQQNQNKKPIFNVGGILAFSLALGAAVGAIAALDALNGIDSGTTLKSIGELIGMMLALIGGEFLIGKTQLTFQQAMAQFGGQQFTTKPFIDFCHGLYECVKAVGLLVLINKFGSLQDIGAALIEFFGIFTVGGVLSQAMGFLATFASNKLGIGINNKAFNNFANFAQGINQIIGAVAQLFALNLLDTAIIDEQGNKISRMAWALIELGAIMTELDLGMIFGAFIGSKITNANGQQVNLEKAMKAMKLFGEAVVIVTGAFSALVGIESIASKEAVDTALAHLAILMGSLIGSDFLTTLIDIMETKLSGGNIMSVRQKVGSLVGFALVLLSAVGAFYTLATIVEGLDQKTIDGMEKTLGPFAALLGVVGSLVVAFSKFNALTGLGGWTVGAQLAFNLLEFFGLFLGAGGILSLFVDQETGVNRGAEAMRVLGETIGAFFSGLTGIRGIDDLGTQFEDLAEGLNGLGDEMSQIEYDKVKPAIDLLWELSEIAANTVGSKGMSLMSLIFGDKSVEGLGNGFGKLGEGFKKMNDSIKGGLDVDAFRDTMTIMNLFKGIKIGEDVSNATFIADNIKTFVGYIKGAAKEAESITNIGDFAMLAGAYKDIAELTLQFSQYDGNWDEDKISNMFFGFQQFTNMIDNEGYSGKLGKMVGEFVNGFTSTTTADEGQMASDALKLIDMYTATLDNESATGGKVYTSGMHFVEGFANGIKENAKLATTEAEALGILTLAALNQSLGIKSPSFEAYLNGYDFGSEEAQGYWDGVASALTESQNGAFSTDYLQMIATNNPDLFGQITEFLEGAGIDTSVLGGMGTEMAQAFISDYDEEGTSGGEVASEDIVNAVLTELGSHYEEMYDTGVQYGIGFANGLASEASISAARNAGTVVGTVALNAARVAGAVASPSRKMFEIGEFFTMGFANGLLDRISDVEGNSKYLAGSAIDSMDSTLNTFSMLQAMGIDPTPTIRPVLDMSDIQAKASELNGLFGDFNTGRMSFGDFGFNTRGNGVSDLQADIRDMKDAIIGLQSHMSSLQIVLDSGALVGGISAGMDRQLGANYTRSRRGG